MGTGTLKRQPAAKDTISEIRQAPEISQEHDHRVLPPIGGIKRARVICGWVDDKARLNKRDGKLYWIGHFKDGKKRIDRVVGPKSDLGKGDAEAKLKDEIIPAYFAEKAGTPIESTQPVKERRMPTWEQAARNYLKLRSASWGDDTSRDMGYIFEKHIIPPFGSTAINEIVPSQVQLLFNEVAEKGGGYKYKDKVTGKLVKQPARASKSLMKKVTTHTRAVFDCCIDDDYIAKNPARARTIKTPKYKKPSKWFIEKLQDIEALLSAAAKRSYRDYMLLRVEFVCALRPEELFALRVDDIGTDRMHIDETVVNGELHEDEAKTEGSLAPVPIPVRLRQELMNYVVQEGIGDKPQAFLFANDFGTPLNGDNYRKRVLQPLGFAAKLKRRLTFQILRRTTATHFQNYGEVKDTQALLRHADAETTLNEYQQTITANLATAAAKWDAQICFNPGGMIQ